MVRFTFITHICEAITVLTGIQCYMYADFGRICVRLRLFAACYVQSWVVIYGMVGGFFILRLMWRCSGELFASTYPCGE